MHWTLSLFLLVLIATSSCRSRDSHAPAGKGAAPATVTSPAQAPVRITLLQMNDVYEMTTADGGLARVATLLERLKAENPNTFSIMAGDLFSPSAIGTAKVDGRPLAGRQMVAVMNTLGIDYMTFGNHEFDLKKADFDSRMEEIRFPMLTSNVTGTNGAAIRNTSGARVLQFPSGTGKPVTLGLFGVTMNQLSSEYVRIQDPVAAARSEAARLRPQVDVLVAITHQPLSQDIEIASAPEHVDLLIGGHEHENIRTLRGSRLVPICKADANARTVFVHRIEVDPTTRKVSIRSDLVPITPDLPEHPAVLAEVLRWRKIAFDAFRAQGFQPDASVAVVKESLDGREEVIRSQPTVLTRLIAASLLHAVPGARVALFNAGSIRVDDVLPPGPLTQYDVLRIMPFGGEVVSVTMSGTLLRRVLDQGVRNAGAGGYLHVAGVEGPAGGWRIAGSEPLNDALAYPVALNDFLLSGREKGLEFLTTNAPGIKVAGAVGVDVRRALMAELRR